MESDRKNSVLNDRSVENDDVKIKNRKLGRYRQYSAAFIVSLLSLSNGLVLAWTNPVEKTLKGRDHPLNSGEVTEAEFSWITSVIFAGAFLGIFIWNPCADKFGRKIDAYLLSLTQILGWLGIIFSISPIHLILSRFILGLGGCGILSVTQLYISETVDDDLKGPLCTLVMIGMNAGILLVNVFGFIFPYEGINVACLSIPLSFVFLFIWLPESPLYLLMKNRVIEANESRAWFGNDTETKSVDLESITVEASYSELFATSKMIRITLIGMMLLAGQQFSGMGVTLSYTENLVHSVASEGVLTYISLLVGLVQFIVSGLSGVVVKSCRRKSLLLFSYFSSSFFFILISAYFMFKNDLDEFLVFKSIPLIGILGYVVVYSLGIGPLPFVIGPEIFSPRVLNHGMSVSLMVLVFSAFLTTKIFPSLKTHLAGDDHLLFLLFAAFNLGFGLFFHKFLWETKVFVKKETGNKV